MCTAWHFCSSHVACGTKNTQSYLCSVLTESGEPEITSVFSNMGYGVPSTKAVVLPDMSIIMEQSLIDVDEDANPESVQMDTGNLISICLSEIL